MDSLIDYSYLEEYKQPQLISEEFLPSGPLIQKDLFVLPNGHPLRYSFPFQKGQAWMTRDNYLIRNWREKTKERQVKIFGWNNGSSNQHVVFADFDQIPCDFDSFDCLEKYLKHLYDKKGLVFRSVSGKCKIAFVIQNPPNIPMTKEIALDVLETILTPELYELIDKQTSSLSWTFANEEIREKISNDLGNIDHLYSDIDLSTENHYYLSSYLPSNIYHLIKDREESYISCIPDHGVKRYNRVSNKLDERLSSFARTKTLNHVLRVLLSTPELLSGYDLSQKLMATTVGVTQKTICLIFKELVKKGLLQVTDSYSIPDKKAITYKASNLLREILEERRKAKRKPPPTEIEDTKWNQTLMKVGFKCFGCNSARFYDWASKIPGSNLKDRPGQIERITKWFSKVKFTLNRIT